MTLVNTRAAFEKAVTDAVADVDPTVEMIYDNMVYKTPGKTKKYVVMFKFIIALSLATSAFGLLMSTPLTWDNPLMPGRKSNIPACCLRLINSICIGKHGLGPTKLISPRITFIICGSSSNLKFRYKFPTLSIGRCDILCVGAIGVPFEYVRIFIIVNGFLCRPNRVWKNSGGSLSMITVIRQSNAIRTKHTGKIMTEIKRSSKRWVFSNFIF